MDEPQSKNLVRRKFNLHHTDTSQAASSAKRSRVNERQDTRPPSIPHLSENSLPPPPAPIGKPSANNREQLLEDSGSETEIHNCFARIRV